VTNATVELGERCFAKPEFVENMQFSPLFFKVWSFAQSLKLNISTHILAYELLILNLMKPEGMQQK
jgi:hypothetical protein